MLVYAITDPTTLNFDTLESDLEYFSSKASMIVYRDKTTQTYRKNAKLFVQSAKSFDRVLLHTDYDLAKECHADGVHLKSTQISDIPKAKILGLFVIVSTHNRQEALQAERLGADMVTFSPIFSTPNKGMPVGLKVLEEVSAALQIPVIALGGIVSKKEIDACSIAGAKGFASIRYFLDTVSTPYS